MNYYLFELLECSIISTFLISQGYIIYAEGDKSDAKESDSKYTISDSESDSKYTISDSESVKELDSESESKKSNLDSTSDSDSEFSLSNLEIKSNEKEKLENKENLRTFGDKESTADFIEATGNKLSEGFFIGIEASSLYLSNKIKSQPGKVLTLVGGTAIGAAGYGIGVSSTKVIANNMRNTKADFKDPDYPPSPTEIKMI
ncbi:hypothetical protein COEREDRAFT_90025 [Coemansia reversa NRRL 1564]|uniref:Uncharacterized protein n=1 Tax=Coemansia reversa (strain ATCC 12441 / NRRL 1564) TaxID=763665 RepID=A0A2G5B1E7_COERN|nr:hypothetical protein COEREDRAFT_90025 [Coemansia reversa NRRL 1564]|eukprot:PIA12833.1 hypothetical protein COEREDRAFT_90025 [Coemansia reversa NRRL 1564]